MDQEINGDKSHDLVRAIQGTSWLSLIKFSIDDNMESTVVVVVQMNPSLSLWTSGDWLWRSFNGKWSNLLGIQRWGHLVKGKPEKVREKKVKDSLNLEIYKSYNNERNDLNSGQIRVKGKNTKDWWIFSPKKMSAWGYCRLLWIANHSVKTPSFDSKSRGLLGLSRNLTKLTRNRKKNEIDGLAGGRSVNEVGKMELTKTAFITCNNQNVTIHALKKVLAKSILFYPHLWFHIRPNEKSTKRWVQAWADA